MAKNHTNVKRTRAQTSKPKNKIEDRYIRGMVIDILVIVGALLVWAGYNHVIPHFWEIQPVYVSQPADKDCTVYLYMDTESKTYERYYGDELESSGTYSLTGRRIKLTDSETGFADSYTMDNGYLVSVNDTFDGRLDSATKFNKTISRTTVDGTITYEFTKDQTYTCTVSTDAGESVTTGTYSRDSGSSPIVLTRSNDDGTTQELQGLYVYDHKATEHFYMAQDAEE